LDNLREILPNKAPVIKTLPVLHSCEAISLLNILESAELKTSHCDVFDKSHLYAFYGIPSYRKTSLSPRGNPGYLPVCFIFDYDKIPDLDKLYPCDTGAFAKLPAIKEKHFHLNTKLENLELESSIDDAKKLIDVFYDTNENYILHKPTTTTEKVDPSKFNSWGYASLINEKIS